MRTDMPAEIWLDPHRWEALQEVLEQDGTDIEEVLQNYLIEVYADRVPFERQKEIDRLIEAERLAAAQEAEARKIFSGMRIREHGQEYTLMEENGREFLQLAALLRRYLRDEFTKSPREFAQVFDHAEEISEKRFDELVDLRLENTGKVSGTFEIDLDKGLLSSLHITDGWQSFRIKDVSTAVYQAYRKSGLSQDERWRRFTEYLEGKQVCGPAAAPAEIQGSRRLRPDDIQLDEEISEMDGVLNFYLACWFDVDAVFGTHVETAENGDWLNVYANYSLTERRVCDTLDLVLHRENGSDEELSYRLDDAEKATLREKMDAYCLKETSRSLDDYCDNLLEQESSEAPELKM